MIDYSDVARRMLGFEDRDLGTGATEDEIREAERALGLRIEGGYRLFLRQFGWGGVGSFELYGLGNGAPSRLDLVRMTHSERTEMRPYTPHHLLPIMDDGGGNLYCLDTRAASEPPIVFWAHDDPDEEFQTPEVYGRDFASWLDEKLDAIENPDDEPEW